MKIVHIIFRHSDYYAVLDKVIRSGLQPFNTARLTPLHGRFSLRVPATAADDAAEVVLAEVANCLLDVVFASRVEVLNLNVVLGEKA